MTDNQQRAIDAIAWDDPRPAVVGGEWRANLADRVAAACGVVATLAAIGLAHAVVAWGFGDRCIGAECCE